MFILSEAKVTCLMQAAMKSFQSMPSSVRVIGEFPQQLFYPAEIWPPDGRINASDSGHWSLTNSIPTLGGAARMLTLVPPASE